VKHPVSNKIKLKLDKAKHQSPDVLFYAEDPGAANYILHLPAVCKERGLSSIAIAAGGAQKFFKKNGVPYEDVSVSETPFSILQSFAPNLLVVGTSENPESPGLKFIEGARNGGIPAVGVVDAFMNAVYRFRGCTDDAMAYAPNWLVVPDKWTKQEFVDLGFPEERAVVCGHPQYDFVRDKAKELEGKDKKALRSRFFPEAPEEKLVAVFAAEISGGLNPDQFVLSKEYTLFGRGVSQKRTDIVVEELLEAIALLPKRPYLVLRLHPKNELSEFAGYMDEFDQISREQPMLDMIFASDCVIGMTSMLLLEAALLGRPTFSIVPKEEERDWLPSIRAGLTPCASTRDEIRILLKGFFESVTSGKRVLPDDAFVFGAAQSAVSLFLDILSTRGKNIQ
jgi:hypothetical protein